MKRLVCVLAVSALIFMPTAGFSSERDLTPTEEVGISDFDYDYDVVVCSDTVEVATCSFTKVELTVFNGPLGDMGLRKFATLTNEAKTKTNKTIYEVDWYIQGFTKNKYELNKLEAKHYTTHGGANLKISLV